MQNDNSKLKTYLLLAGLILLISAGLVQAQSFLGGADFFVKLSPEMPGPNTEVRAELRSFSFDVDRLEITWILNGEVVLKGIGEKSLRFSTDKAGKKTTLKALLLTEDGFQYQKTMDFDNVGLDLLWEAKTSAPAWYKGKPLPVINSLVKVAAFPDFPGANPNNLIYQWSRNNEKAISASGFGKRTFTFLMPKNPYAREIIELTVSNFSKTITAKKTIRIDVRFPKVLLYQNLALEGPWFQKSLDNFVMKQEILEIKAEPYFFSKYDLTNLSYRWLVNNQEAAAQTNKNIFSLNISPNIFGPLTVQLEVQNPKELFQLSQTSIRIIKE